MKRHSIAILVTMIALAVASSGYAGPVGTMLFDRGLPTANLNNGAGASRSNVLWADSEPTNDLSTFWLPGDDFTLAGSGPYTIGTIRVWSTDAAGLSLYGGLAGGPITLQSVAYSSTLVGTYDGGLGYQGNSGGYSPVYQIDFSVDIALNGGETYQFFLGGPASLYDPSNPGSSPYVDAFLHASNAGLSGSTQQGADGTFLWLAPDGTVETWVSTTGGAWDKASDGNVQVFAPVPDGGTTATLLGCSLLGLGALRRKFRR